MMMIDTNSPEFQQAVRDTVRDVLRSELNDYIPNGAILAVKIAPQRIDGEDAQTGDTLQYNASGDGLMEVAP